MYFANKKITKIYLGYVPLSGESGSSGIATVNYNIDSSNTVQLFKVSGSNALDYTAVMERR